MSVLNKIPADKLGHLKAGALAALFGAMLAPVLGLLLSVMLPPLLVKMAGTGALVSALAAGLTKEKADALDNASSPGMHEVSWKDAAFTAAPGVIVFVLAFLVSRFIS